MPFTFRLEDADLAGISGLRMMFTKGFTLENKPSRDLGGAHGRKRVGDVPTVGEAGCEDAGHSKSRGTVQYD
jgi:hypothetical protein